MKILLAGAWEYPIYEAACANALKSLDVDVIPHAWGPVFQGLRGKAERKYTLPGPGTKSLNSALLKAVETTKPDVVWIWRGTHVFPETLAALRPHTRLLIGYNNDDPFSPRYLKSLRIYERRMWMYFNAGLPHYDLQLAFRPVNIPEYQAAGVRHVSLLPPYYRDGVDRKLVLNAADRERFGCEVAFIGHYENDGREAMLRRLVLEGVDVKLFGDASWRKSGVERRLKRVFGPIQPVYGEEYVKALNGAQIALGFLSKRHRDPYTRRCFEIPACGALLLAERTPELQAVLAEGKDADYFAGEDELFSKVSHYLSNPRKRERVAASGHERVQKDGHGVAARMNRLKLELEQLLREEKTGDHHPNHHAVQ